MLNDPIRTRLCASLLVIMSHTALVTLGSVGFISIINLCEGNNSKNEASNEIGKERFLSALGKSSLLNPNLYSLNSLKLISLINPVPFEVDSIVASCLTTIISSFVI